MFRRMLVRSVVVASLIPMAAAVAPHAAASVPTAITIHVLRDAQGNAWWSEGALADAGVFHDNPGFFAGQSSTYHVVRTFRGEDGTLRMRGDVRIVPTAAPGVFDVVGRWAVLSGTRDYSAVHGAGEIAEVFDTNAGQIVGTWTGVLVT